jgi:hypothetical protein
VRESRVKTRFRFGRDSPENEDLPYFRWGRAAQLHGRVRVVLLHARPQHPLDSRAESHLVASYFLG